jgi:hypothetical protein
MSGASGGIARDADLKFKIADSRGERTGLQMKIEIRKSRIPNRQSSIHNHQGALTLRDGKYEGRTSEITENKGPNKVVLRVW